MNDGVFASPPPQPPHLNQLFGSKMSLQSSSSNPAPPSSHASRKRKADDDLGDIRMSASPTSSPSLSYAPLPRPLKKTRAATAVGRPLSLTRLLETLDADSLRTVLRTVAEAHPQLAAEIPRLAPRPSVSSAHEVLRRYQQSLHDAFPFGGDPSSDYAFNRVRGHLSALLEALADFTPHFLPPHETAPGTTLLFLDGATSIIDRLPDWRHFQNNVPKYNAYEEIGRAWVVAIQEAAKRAAGLSLRYDGWDKKLAKHNQLSGGRLQAAVEEMNKVLGWTAGGSGSSGANGGQSQRRDDTASVREQLLSGTYGSNVPVRVGPW